MSPALGHRPQAARRLPIKDSQGGVAPDIPRHHWPETHTVPLSIRCTSSVGQGSTFVLEFPLRLADDAAAASVAAPPAPGPAAEGERP
jgi:hypothetical protein